MELPHILVEYPQIGRWNSNSLERHAGFSGAVVWKVETDVGPVALRKWPSGWNSTRLAGLHRLLEFLHRKELEIVAAPWRTRAGHTLLVCNRHLFQVEPWLPGVADFRKSPTETRLTAAMTALARWHIQAARFQPAAEHRGWFASQAPNPSPAVQERLRRMKSISEAMIRQWGDSATAAGAETRSLAQRLTEAILKHAASVLSMLQMAATVPVPLQPVLRDVWHDHILFSGDEVTGIIDPSACRTESVSADLARLLGSLLGDDTAAWDCALAAYQRYRPLSSTELGLVPVLDRSGVLLSGITWLEWLGPQQRFVWDDPRVLVRLTEITQCLEGWR